MEFRLVTPAAVKDLPQRDSYLEWGSTFGIAIQIRHKANEFTVTKVHQTYVAVEEKTGDFQEALLIAHKMWSK